MVAATTELTGQCAHQVTFQDVDYSGEFDGIWACASLLQVPQDELPDVLGRFARALRPEGVCYLSFREGTGERIADGRLFTDMDESGVDKMVAGIEGLEIVQLWHTNDMRPGRSDRWLNVILRKVGPCGFDISGAGT